MLRELYEKPRDRARCPALPARFEEPVQARKAVEAAWRRPWASGIAAFDGDQLVAYLFADAAFDQLMGRTAWVQLAGHAHSERVDVDVYRDLYAAAAPRWLALGCFDHCAMIPSGDRELLDVWYALSFGQQQAHALRSITDGDDKAIDPHDGITIRRARPEDRTALAEMALVTAEHQAQAPVWAPLPAEIASPIGARPICSRRASGRAWAFSLSYTGCIGGSMNA